MVWCVVTDACVSAMSHAIRVRAFGGTTFATPLQHMQLLTNLQDALGRAEDAAGGRRAEGQADGVALHAVECAERRNLGFGFTVREAWHFDENVGEFHVRGVGGLKGGGAFLWCAYDRAVMMRGGESSQPRRLW